MEAGGTRLVMDLGPGAFANLQLVADPATIDAVVLTHHHPDHWSDLQGLATHARFVLGRSGLPVYAPADLVASSGLADSAALDWRVVTDGDDVDLGPLRCAFSRTDHAFETLAVRVDGGGRALGYSADTGPGWSPVELGPDLDLLLSEATYTVEHEGTAGHMSGRQAGEQARRCGARRLVVTHRWPTVAASAVAAEAGATFGGPVEQAAVGTVFGL